MINDSDFIVDVGMCDGSDTAYYLSKGYRVLAIEADPILCEKARVRFASEIDSGKLNLLNIGIAQSEGLFSFYKNLDDPGASTIISENTLPGDRYEMIQIKCYPLNDILQEFGIPFYMKIDIEGVDEIAVKSLKRDLTPRYISAELSYSSDLLKILNSLGYRKFKLINQAYHTTSLDISDNEYHWRLLRKIGRVAPVVRSFVCKLPHRFRARTEWDRRFSPDEWDAQGGSYSGPFAEATHGTWLSFSRAASTFEYVQARHSFTWWDVHAGK